MRNILMTTAAGMMLIGVAHAQTTASGSGMQNSSTQTTKKAGAMPGTNVSGATSDKGKGTMPENPNAKKGTVSGTSGSGAKGSGPNASDSANK